MRHLSHEQLMALAWEKVTPELKERVRAAIPVSMAALALEHKRQEELYWHFSGGMAVRNHLRKTIPDADLPPFDEYYGVGTDVRNWDDYYEFALRHVAGEID